MTVKRGDHVPDCEQRTAMNDNYTARTLVNRLQSEREVFFFQ